MANYSYPRVAITTTAKVHSQLQPTMQDTTVLFMPLFTKKGPSKTIVPIHTLGELVEVFGELDYEKNLQAALNAYNWLSAGGTLYVYRLELEKEYAIYKHIKETDEEINIFKAKYPGKYYEEKVNIELTKISENTYRVVVYENKLKVEEYRINKNNFYSILNASNFIIWHEELVSKYENFEELEALLDELFANNKVLKISNSIQDESSDKDGILQEFFTTDIDTVLGNHLETPIDVLMDAGYPQIIKENIIRFVAGKVDEAGVETPAVRPDIFAFIDSHAISGYLTTPVSLETVFEDEKSRKSANFAVYEQYFTINDEILTNRSMYVAPSYFLSKLIPYNDLQYGVQFPTAGLRRGILTDALAINENPTPDKKDQWFLSRFNYVEKSSREYAFMNQRTFDGSSDEEYTALSFINNSRTLCKLRKELERLGREYLFEFNDSVTLAQLSNVLNKYMNNWVSNRTLSYALVVVEKNPYLEEAVDISLNIRFNGTIEVISVDITIE